MKNTKFWIVVSLLIVFAAGVAGGILFDKYYTAKKWRRPDRKNTQVRFPTLEIMAEELRLSEDQQNRIKELFRQNEEEFKDLRIHMRTRLSEMRKVLITDIKTVLDEEQASKFEAMIEKYLAGRQREADGHRRRPDGPADKK